MERFFGGNPAGVILKLAVASVIIGVILSAFGFNPDSLYDAVMEIGKWISNLSFDAVKRVTKYLALGAIIVIPLWLISRVFSILGSDPSKK